MNQDVLDRLLMDRALGALPLDVNALLNAYLEREPAMAARAVEMDQTLALAKRALQPHAEPALPPLKVRPLAAGEVNMVPRNRLMWAVGLAAAFVLGIGLSAMFLHSTPTPARPVVVEVVRPVDAGPSGFWSRARWTNLLAKASQPEEPRLTWISPVKRPVVNN